MQANTRAMPLAVPLETAEDARQGFSVRSRSAARTRQPCANLSHALLYTSNLPLEALPVFPVVLRRGVKLSPVVGYVGGQLGALPPKGLAFVRGSGHVANDSAGGKEARGRGRPRSSAI